MVIAGGEKAEDDREVFQIIKDSIDAGGGGVSIGRNAFQHENKKAMVKAICGIVHEGISVDRALEILNA